MFANQSIFLVCGGPSTKEQDLSLLLERGIITAAVNNVAAKNIRPNIWVCTDGPMAFCENIWLDPAIMKFVASDNSYFHFNMSDGSVGPLSGHSSPNTLIYDKISEFNSNEFLSEPRVSWGCAKRVKCDLGLSGGRSVLLATLKILYVLGFSRVYLLGCDFNMQPGEEYSFPQSKTPKKIAVNNAAYKILSARLEKLQPLFLTNDFNVFNCNLNSNLNAFPKINYLEAIKEVLSKFPTNVKVEDRYITMEA